jgi:hypothetical protein
MKPTNRKPENIEGIILSLLLAVGEIPSRAG